MAKKLDFSNKKTFGIDNIPESKNNDIQLKEGSVVKIPLNLIDLGDNIRDLYDDEEDQLNELGLSIKTYGQLEPVIVFKTGDRYTLKIGSRRFKACQLQDIPTIDAVISTPFNDEIERIIVQAIENEQRKDMSSREREKYIGKLREFGLTNEDIAFRLHKSKSWISKVMQAHDFIKKNEDIFTGLDFTPNTETVYTASKLEPKKLDEILDNIKESNNKKSDFEKSIKNEYSEQKKKAEKKETNSKIIMTPEIDEDSVNLYKVEFSVEENKNGKKVNVKNLTQKNELNNFIENKIKEFYETRGYIID